MKGFFRSIGKGILYLLTPFAWVVGITLGSVVALVVFLGYAVYFIFCFFTGRNLFNDLPEDKRAKEILAAQADPTLNQPQVAPQPQTQVYMNNPQVNLYQNPGYPYPPQGQPYPQGNPYMQAQPQPSIQVTVQPQPEPIPVQPAPQIEEQPMEPEYEEPQQEDVQEQPMEEEVADDFETIETNDEEEIGEYVPQGGNIFKKDLKDDYDD